MGVPHFRACAHRVSLTAGRTRRTARVAVRRARAVHPDLFDLGHYFGVDFRVFFKDPEIGISLNITLNTLVPKESLGRVTCGCLPGHPSLRYEACPSVSRPAHSSPYYPAGFHSAVTYCSEGYNISAEDLCLLRKRQKA